MDRAFYYIPYSGPVVIASVPVMATYDCGPYPIKSGISLRAVVAQWLERRFTDRSGLVVRA